MVAFSNSSSILSLPPCVRGGGSSASIASQTFFAVNNIGRQRYLRAAASIRRTWAAASRSLTMLSPFEEESTSFASVWLSWFSCNSTVVLFTVNRGWGRAPKCQRFYSSAPFLYGDVRIKTELLYSRPSLTTQSMILGRRSDSIRFFSQSFRRGWLCRFW